MLEDTRGIDKNYRKLIERLILTSSNEGDIVLDPFGGSASTAIASKKNRRNFIVIEIDDVYYETSLERYNNFVEKLSE